MLIVLDDKSSAVSQYISELRDRRFLDDRHRFTTTIEKLSHIAGYELSKKLSYGPQAITTPAGKRVEGAALVDPVVIAAVLRAGLPVQRGLYATFPHAEQAFVAAARHGNSTGTGFDIDVSYLASPPLEGKTLIIADTMIATGNSILKVYASLIKHAEVPRQIWVVGIIASKQAIATLQAKLPSVHLIVGAVDPLLNRDFLIVPGLGDAGDRLFGEKKKQS